MKTKLYIIGNGFDIASKLNTSYWDFREYLLSKSTENYNENCKIHFPIYKKGVLAPNDYQNAKLIVKMIDSALKRQYGKRADWKYFEDVLGKLEHKDLNKSVYPNTLTDVAIHIAFTKIENYFRDWIIYSTEKQPCEVVFDIKDDDALYLNFNYTLTLENTYEIPSHDICHIHGKIGDKTLVIGHKDYEERICTTNLRRERQIQIVREMLIKDTEYSYYSNVSFFEKINTNIKTVISIGFSYSEVDMDYIDKIIECIGKNSIWCIYNYKLTESLWFKMRLREHGFKGKIKFFRNIK